MCVNYIYTHSRLCKNSLYGTWSHSPWFFFFFKLSTLIAYRGDEQSKIKEWNSRQTDKKRKTERGACAHSTYYAATAAPAQATESTMLKSSAHELYVRARARTVVDLTDPNFNAHMKIYIYICTFREIKCVCTCCIFVRAGFSGSDTHCAAFKAHIRQNGHHHTT